MKKKLTVAFMYDFDKTLCDEDMQHYSFIPNLGMTSEEFWAETEAFRKKNYMEGILGYMYYMMYKCKEKGIPFTQEYLRSLGKDVVFYKGVQNWFKRINQYGESIGVNIEHYVISSGVKDIIDGSAIKDEFKKNLRLSILFRRENGRGGLAENRHQLYSKNAVYFPCFQRHLRRNGQQAGQRENDRPRRQLPKYDLLRRRYDGYPLYDFREKARRDFYRALPQGQEGQGYQSFAR